MDRDRAAEIQKHLLEASDALDRVTEAMFKLDKDERKAFAEILFGIHDALHFGLLRALYGEHPELIPILKLIDRCRPNRGARLT